jgi:hypothetical protein
MWHGAPNSRILSTKVSKATHNGLFEATKVLQITAAQSDETLVDLLDELAVTATLELRPHFRHLLSDRIQLADLDGI